MLKQFLVVAAVAGLVSSGCGPAKSDKSTKSASGDKTSTAELKTSKKSPGDKPVPEMSAVASKPITATSEDGSTIELYQETWADTQKFIASQTGKVVVVDFWATY